MALPPGAKLGPYEVLALIGAGGMGEVYRARDPRLNRDVAIKVLPAERVADEGRRRRFVQEAQAASALNHPHIITIHEIESADGRDFIVMELVRGRSLDTLISRNGMRLSEVVRIAIAVADALAAAHAHGIVHRDLKPANVMVGQDGAVKVLDFGLAKLLSGEAAPEDATASVAANVGLSAPGTIAGTAAYMSPEQASGAKVDARSDTFSFGAMLYEMVTGTRAFTGTSSADTINAVMRAQPKAPSAIIANVPSDLEKVIVRCLRKDPDRRFQHIADVKVALQEVKEDSESGRLAVTAPPRPRRRWIVAAGVASAVIVVAILAATFWSGARDAPRVRVVPLTTLTGWEDSPTFSPDGTQVAFLWTGEKGDNADIYVKIVGANEVRRITTDPGFDFLPSWSPDGRQIAFLHVPPRSSDAARIYLVSPLGGQTRKLSDLPVRGPLAWTPDGQFIAAAHALSNAPSSESRNNGIYLIPADGGKPRGLTEAIPPSHHDAPAFSPDGHRLAYAICPQESGDCDVYVSDLNDGFAETNTPRRLTTERVLGIAGTAWTPDGKSVIYSAIYGLGLAYLWRVKADGATGQQRIEEAGSPATSPSISVAGHRLAFTRDMEDVDVYAYDGVHTVPLLTSSSWDMQPDYSPDGRRLAFNSLRSGEQTEVWVANADGSEPSQLTHGPGRLQGSPHWSPDGRRIAFDSHSTQGWHIWTIDADGGVPQQVTKDAGSQTYPSWSSDGRWIYYSSGSGEISDLWRIRVDSGQKELVQQRAAPFLVETPDGKNILYQGKVGNSPLMIRPLAGGPARQLVSCVGFAQFGVRATEIYYCPCHEGWDTPVRAIDSLTGRDRVVGSLEHRGGGGAVSGMTISPDGKTILYGRTVREGSDLMLIENFK